MSLPPLRLSRPASCVPPFLPKDVPQPTVLPPLQSTTPLLQATMAARAALNHQYCKVITHTAMFRATMQHSVGAAILSWLEANRHACSLFGRRAWNAHIVVPALRDETTDYDIMVHRARDMDELRQSLAKHLFVNCGEYEAYTASYEKHHADSCGRTFTVEVCGVQLVDLVCREGSDGFLVPFNGDPVPLHVAEKEVEGKRVTVLAVATLRNMLEAETRAKHWRHERAQSQLERYRLFESMGWMAADVDEVGSRASITTGEADTDDDREAEEDREKERDQDACTGHERIQEREQERAQEQYAFQLPLLARHLRTASTVDECRAVTRFFFCSEEDDDPMRIALERIQAARTLEECRLLERELSAVCA